MNHTNEVIGVGYIRVSTQKQADEGVSLKVQRREVEKKLSDLGCTEIITFEDEGKSAKTIVGRDGFQDAINSAIKAKAKLFCTYDTSRFARNTEDAVKFLNALRKNGTELICVTTRFEDTPEGRLAFRMLSSIDEYYSDSLGNKIRESNAKLREQGYFPGKAPKGYDNIRVQGKADIILNKGGLALKITFRNYLDGLTETLREVAADLDRNGFEPEKKTSFQTASRLLKTPFYAGIFWDKSINDYRTHNYEKIITLEEYELIQEKLAGRSVQKNVYQKVHPDYPLRSILYCSKCGRKMKGYPAKGNGGIYYYYDCPTKGCTRARRTSEIHQEFHKEINDLEPSPEVLNLFERILSNTLIAGLKEESQTVKRYHNRIKQLEKEQTETLSAITKLSNKDVIKGLEAKYTETAENLSELKSSYEQLTSKLSQENCEPIIQEGLDLLRNPYSIWKNADAHLKHKYQKWIFPEGIEYSEDFGLRTRRKNYTYQLLEALEANDSDMVETAGIEPASSKLGTAPLYKRCLACFADEPKD